MANELTSADRAVARIQDTLNSEKCLTALQTACAKGIEPARLIKTVESVVRKTPQLQECSVSSIYGAVLECATLGLEPILGRAYFVPFNNKGQKDLQLIIGYQGLIELGRRCGVECWANAVYEGETLEWTAGFEETLVHKPRLDVKHSKETLVYVYCVWQYNGAKHAEVMSKDDVEKIRRKSKCGNAGPWVDHYDEMAKKTVIRRASKKWPLLSFSAVADAIERDDDRTFRSEGPVHIKSATDELRAQLGLKVEEIIEEAPEKQQDAMEGFYAALGSIEDPEQLQDVIANVGIALENGEITNNDYENFNAAYESRLAELKGEKKSVSRRLKIQSETSSTLF